LIEEMKTRGAPFAVSCALHVGLVAGLILTQHWVSSAVALRPPVLPVQLVMLDAPAPAPPPAPEPARVPVKPPRLLAPPKPKEPPVARRQEPPVLPPPAPIASAPTPTPAPAPAAAAPAPAAPVSDAPAAAVEPATAPTASSTTFVSSSGGGETAPAAPAPPGPRTAAVAPEGLTQYARPQGGYQVRPNYPASARRLGVQGTTLLRVHVLADGHIGDVLVEKSAGHPDLDDAATDAVKRWRFDPARRGKEAVAMWVLLPVEFKLR
jgi:protein TonB